ncbi:MAG: PAS domain S-box protein [Prolixibacteraceae bacterium]|nr:PAS domain S-box protein [Prolixibacteraceae bacterium]
MQFDPLSLSFTLALIYLVAAFALMLVGSRIKVFSGIICWGTGALFVAIGFFGFFLRQFSEIENMTVLLSNLFQLIGFVFLYEGTLRFFGHQRRSFLFLVLALAFIPLMLYFTLVDNNLKMRILIFALSFSVYFAFLAHLFFKAKKGQGRSAAIYIGSALTFMSVMLLLRFLVVAFVDVDLSFEAGNLGNSIFFIVGIIVTLFFAFGLALLISQRLNDKLSGSRNHFKLIFETIPDPITISEKDTGKIVDVNSGFVKTTGYQPEEIIGGIPLEIGLWKDPGERELFFREIEEKGYCYNFETTFKNKDDEEVIALFSGVVFNNEGRDYLLSVAHVITEIRKVEEEALVLKSAVEQSPASIVITDSNGLIKYVNPWFTKVTGYTYNEVVGETPRVLQSGNMPKSFYAEMWTTIREGKKWHGEFENRKKNGEIFWESASISGLKNDNGEVTHFVAVKEDITQRKIFNEEVRIKNQQLNELNAQKDRLFSIISHDLRGPFNGFLGLTNLMADDADSMTKDEMVDIASGIRKSASNVFELLNNLLDWSRNQQGLIPFRPEKVNVNDMLEDCFEGIEGVARNKNIQLNLSTGNELVCNGDENMLKTIVRNLVSNAMKFTPRGGIVKVEAEEDDGFVKFSITDNGIGMSEEMLEKLFNIDKKINRTGTENEPSTGLGLIICRDFVKKHGGEIWAESDPDGKSGEKGTTFYFTVPAAR